MKKLILFLFLGFMLIIEGCFYSVNKSDIGTVFILNDTSFLVESRASYYGISLKTRYNLCAIAKCHWVVEKFPTAEGFNNNKIYWQQVKKDKLGNEERILGVVPQGTHYILLDRYSGTIDSEPYLLVRLTEGPFAGKTTYLNFP